MTLMGLVQAFFGWLKRSRWKILLFFVSTLAFIVFLFPFDDVADLASGQIAAMTQNNVFVQFDRMKLAMSPTPGLQFDNLDVEITNGPGLKAKELTVTPSLSAALKQRPFGELNAKGLMGGNVDLHVSSGARTENGLERYKVDLKSEKLSLANVRELASLPVMLKGRLDVEGSALADPTWTEQPEVDLSLNVSQFELPPSNVNTQMGPLTLPEIKLAKVALKGKLSAGRFLIEKGDIGKEGDDIFGTVKGSMNVTVQNQGGRPVPVPGSYNLEVDLQMSKAFVARAQMFLILMDQYKTENEKGARYRMRVSANSFGLPPSMTPLR